MTEIPAIYISLPEDLAPLEKYGRAVALAPMSVHIGGICISISQDAYAAIGRPERLEILFGARSRMLAFRPAPTRGYIVGYPKHGISYRVGNKSLIQELRIPASRHHHPWVFTAQLVDGALLIGPLPEAEVRS